VTGFVRLPHVNIGALGMAAVVTLGVVTSPPERYDSMVARTEFAAVQLQAAVATEISAVANTASRAVDPTISAGANAAPLAATAVPTASATADDLLGLLGGLAISAAVIASPVVGIVLAPLWWVAFPITYPLVLNFNPLAIPSQFAPFAWFVAPVFLPAIAVVTTYNSLFPAPAATARRSGRVAAEPAATASETGEAQVDVQAGAENVIAGSTPEATAVPSTSRARHSRATARTAAPAVTPADSPPAAPTAVPATATSDETIAPTQPELAANATRTDAADTAADPPPADAAASSTATQQSNQAPARQREGKTRATRSAANAGRA